MQLADLRSLCSWLTRARRVLLHPRPHTLLLNAKKRVFYGLAGERSRLMNWPDPSPARSLSLVVG